MIVTLTRIAPLGVVRAISLVCYDFCIHVYFSSGSNAYPIVFCVSSKVGASSYPTWDSLPTSLSVVKEPWHK